MGRARAAGLERAGHPKNITIGPKLAQFGHWKIKRPTHTMTGLRSVIIDGIIMSTEGLSERAAFRIAEYTFLAASALVLAYWALVLLGHIRDPVAGSAKFGGAVVALASMRAGAQWLAGDHRQMYPLTILIWAICAIGGVALMIFS